MRYSEKQDKMLYDNWFIVVKEQMTNEDRENVNELFNLLETRHQLVKTNSVNSEINENIDKLTSKLVKDGVILIADDKQLKKLGMSKEYFLEKPKNDTKYEAFFYNIHSDKDLKTQWNENHPNRKVK